VWCLGKQREYRPEARFDIPQRGETVAKLGRIDSNENIQGRLCWALVQTKRWYSVWIVRGT